MRHWRGGSRAGRFAYPDTSATFAPETNLLGLKRFAKDGFTCGIEILNDNATPMDFVVNKLCAHLGIAREEAVTRLRKTRPANRRRKPTGTASAPRLRYLPGTCTLANAREASSLENKSISPNSEEIPCRRTCPGP